MTGRICVQAFEFPANYPKDPADRVIGATAVVEGLNLVTADQAIRPVKSRANDLVNFAPPQRSP